MHDMCGQPSPHVSPLHDSTARLNFCAARRACCAQQILHADAPPCELYDKKCTGKADNPNCLCGLIPAPTGHRRQGLWQKDAAALAKLGPDPSADKREVFYPRPNAP